MFSAAIFLTVFWYFLGEERLVDPTMRVFSHTLFPNHSRPSPDRLYSGYVRKVGIVSVDSSSGVGYRCSRNNGVGNRQASVFQADLSRLPPDLFRGRTVLPYPPT